MGASWETCSFVLRTLGTKNQQSIAFVVVSQILLLLAPLCKFENILQIITLCSPPRVCGSYFCLVGINAFDYMILGRMVYYFLPEKILLRVHASKFSLCFVLLDIVSFIVQAAGGTILSGNNVPPRLMTIGKNIYIAGIGLQQFFILIFFAVAIVFHRRVLVLEREGALAKSGKTGWRCLLYVLYVTLVLISVSLLSRSLTTYSTPV
jgi:hypothetical protein